MITFAGKATFSAVLILAASLSLYSQSRHSTRGPDSDGVIFSVFASRTDSKTDPIKMDNLSFYENGIEQKIKNFSFDPSPSRIVILVDNSQTLPTAVDAMKKAVMDFAYEIFEGDQLFVIAYDEKPEIIQEWTDDAKKIEASLETFRKKGNPYLFDALHAATSEVLLPLMPGTRKTAVVIIGDGLDRGSKTTFDKALAELEGQDVTVYALQLNDRTGGAYRRNQPKATEVINQLTEETGGKAYPFEESEAAAKAICDELRKNRYLLSYMPVNTSAYDARSLFLVPNGEGISIRMKKTLPPNVK